MLNWDWTMRMGTCEVVDIKDKKHTYNIYQGNALMIMVWENETQYDVVTFWTDEKHAKNCLGLTKENKESIYFQWKEMNFWLDGNYENSYKIAKLLKQANIHFTLEF